MSEQNEISFNLKKVYVKDISFESPLSPQIFLNEQAPEVDVQMNITHSKVKDSDLYEVILTITVTAKNGESNFFLCEVQQGGLFEVTGAEEELPMVLEIACPNILLPFIREAISDLVGKGGFPQLLINPINFEALFQQTMMAKQSGQKPN
ncbi:MAG TPA: protein-export chaperone SecB [Gammaproteobacteria bacterium]|nr:protein-export protein SecB [bacterium BMS3Abin11]GMT40194.1 MAG: protein-export protein SecB [bacterium]HDH17012.1 protein-export chaperone SecB [Gammaproteobacteria bacterium]HDZ78547.1 protein-export chaperone SecB [Gammaproteobacteria bacterium]